MDCKGLVYELIDIVDLVVISNAGQLSQQIVLIDGILYGISWNTRKCELGQFLLRRSHIDAVSEHKASQTSESTFRL